MKISNLFKQKNTVISFEIFPPKPETPFEPILDTVKALKDLNPDFISITYGAGGSNRGRTMDLAELVRQSGKTESLAHLTCIIDTPNELDAIIFDIKSRGIENILALRGDPPLDSEKIPLKIYAKDLIRRIKEKGDFSIGGAAYPEGHPECDDKKKDVLYLKEKIDAGTDFLITQICFDNNYIYSLKDKLLSLGKDIPISVGIMPVFSKNQIIRICSMCGTSIPQNLSDLMEKYGNDNKEMEKAGLEYACEQIEDLLSNNISGLHLYTMNKPHLAVSMIENTGIINL